MLGRKAYDSIRKASKEIVLPSSFDTLDKMESWFTLELISKVLSVRNSLNVEDIIFEIAALREAGVTLTQKFIVRKLERCGDPEVADKPEPFVKLKSITMDKSSSICYLIDLLCRSSFRREGFYHRLYLLSCSCIGETNQPDWFDKLLTRD